MTTKDPRYVASTGELRGRIDAAMRAGTSLNQIDGHIIRPQGLNDESEGAMWLYARSWEQGRRGYLARQAATARAARDAHPVGTE
jgi:hypothetical protein